MSCLSKGSASGGGTTLPLPGVRQDDRYGMEDCMTILSVAAAGVIAVALYHYFVNVQG